MNVGSLGVGEFERLIRMNPEYKYTGETLEMDGCLYYIPLNGTRCLICRDYGDHFVIEVEDKWI